jgi:hypothetical protein
MPEITLTQVSTTGSTLYEAIEPAILWKHLLRMTISDLVGPASAMGVNFILPSSMQEGPLICAQGIRLTAFTLKQFHHDEEMQTYHLPVVLAALLDIFKVGAPSRSRPISHTKLGPSARCHEQLT